MPVQVAIVIYFRYELVYKRMIKNVAVMTQRDVVWNCWKISLAVA